MKNIFSNLKGDLFGGITAGIVALPLALAFGVQSGLGAAAGLYGAIFIGMLAAIFGGTASQISGPTAPMTVISTVLVAEIVRMNNGELDKALPTILFVFLLAGIFQVLLGILKVGSYIKYIPYPVVSGFMTGIGVIILITQIFPTFGYNPTLDSQLLAKYKPLAEESLLNKILADEASEGILVIEDFEETIARASNISEAEVLKESKTLISTETGGVVGSIKYASNALRNINWLEFLLTLGTVFIIYGFKRITKLIPSTLVALVVITGLVQILGWNALTIADKSPIPSGFPLPKLSIFYGVDLGLVMPYIVTAITLAGLGAIDSLLTSVVADNITKTKHNSNRELVGQGIGNSIAALFGGIRTVVNIQSGGKTRLSGVVHGLLLLMVLLILGPIASKIPLSVLAGILITVGIGVMDYRGLKALGKMPKSDAIVIIVVLLLTVFLDLITAVAVGLILASIIFMKKMSDVTARQSSIKTLGNIPREDIWKDEIDFPNNLKEEVYIKHIDGPLFFGYTADFSILAQQIPETATHVVIRMDKVPYMDQSGLYAFEESILQLQQKNIEVLLVGVQEQPLFRLQTINLVPTRIPAHLLFETFADSLGYIKAYVKNIH